MADVDIIVPAYQSEGTILPAVQSVLCWKEIEPHILIIDDGSSDATGKIADSIAEKESRVTVVHQKNAGRSEARNTGIKNAKSDWIMFLDSDDLFCKNIDKFIKIDIEQNHPLTIYAYQDGSQDKGIAERGSCSCISAFTALEMLTNATKARESEALRNLVSHQDTLFEMNAVWGKLYRRDVIADAEFDPGLAYSEDKIFNIKILNNIQRIYKDNPCVCISGTKCITWGYNGFGTCQSYHEGDILNLKHYLACLESIKLQGGLTEYQMISALAEELTNRFTRSARFALAGKETADEWVKTLTNRDIRRAARWMPSYSKVNSLHIRPLRYLLHFGGLPARCAFYIERIILRASDRIRER